jgi:hypothetical protein
MIGMQLDHEIDSLWLVQQGIPAIWLLPSGWPYYQPLVTMGGGILPLPTKQPARLSEPTTNATASASFFTYALLRFDSHQRMKHGP